MATDQYRLSLEELRVLMELRGQEAVEQLRQYGGVQEVCNKLNTSSTRGVYFSLFNWLNIYNHEVGSPVRILTDGSDQ